MLWYCFGVGFANFGSPPAPSVSALRLADHDPRIDFLASYRATGNYVVRAPNDVAGLLRRELNRLTDAEDRWAVVPDDAFEKALTAFEAWQPPDPERLVRRTPGWPSHSTRGRRLHRLHVRIAPNCVRSMHM
jgi:hypothetical protein